MPGQGRPLIQLLNSLEHHILTYASEADFELAHGAGQIGDYFYDTTARTIKVHDGASWVSIGGGGGGSSLVWLTDEAGPSPLEGIESSQRTFQFEASATQKLFTVIKVPDSYAAGIPIKLRIAAYSPSTSGNFLLRSVATLIRKDTDSVSSTTNQRTSTNTALTNAGSANVYREIELDLTDNAGAINAVAVSPGDFIRTELNRGTDTDTAAIRFLPDASEVIVS